MRSAMQTRKTTNTAREHGDWAVPYRLAHFVDFAVQGAVWGYVSRVSEFAPEPGELRAGETGNLPATVGCLDCTSVSRGVHCEAPLFAACCRACRDSNPAADGLWRWGRQVH